MCVDTDILVEREQDIVWIRLNRPAKANAMTVAMSQQARDAVVDANRDDAVKAIVLTAVGEKMFSAGVDIREASPDGDAAAQRARRSASSAALQDALLDSRKPVVVALNGAAIGGGAMLALLADACIAVPSASLALPEIDLGIATFLGASIVQTLGGRALAADLILRARRMGAEEAHARGLIAQLAEPAVLRQHAAALAQALGAKPASVYADIKAWINRPLKAALVEARARHAQQRANHPTASKP